MFDPGPPAPWPWLLEDRPVEHLARLVCLSSTLTARQKRIYCREFGDRWGAGELIRALRLAHSLAPLDMAMSQLLVELTQRETTG